MTKHRGRAEPVTRWILPLMCCAVSAAAVYVVCTSSGPAKAAGGLILLSDLAGTIWVTQRRQLAALAPAIGLVLVALILTGTALAVAHSLSTSHIASAVGALTLVAACLGMYRSKAERLEHTEPLKRAALPTAVGVAFLLAAAAFAVYHSVVSATTDANQATSLAFWAYPADQELHVGAQQPPGARSISLQVVVTRAGRTATVWNDVRLPAGGAWQAPPLRLTGDAPTEVVAREGSRVVANLSVDPISEHITDHLKATRKQRHRSDRKRHER
jgi:hypothetical protein